MTGALWPCATDDIAAVTADPHERRRPDTTRRAYARGFLGGGRTPWTAN